MWRVQLSILFLLYVASPTLNSFPLVGMYVCLTVHCKSTLDMNRSSLPTAEKENVCLPANYPTLGLRYFGMRVKSRPQAHMRARPSPKPAQQCSACEWTRTIVVVLGQAGGRQGEDHGETLSLVTPHLRTLRHAVSHRDIATHQQQEEY